MIKTVSFAPPRSNSSRSSASPRKSGGKAASGSPSPQISLSLSFDDPAPKPDEKPVKIAKIVVPEPNLVVGDSLVAARGATPELKAKKVRVPKDLAAQYGEKVEIRPAAPTVLEAETPKKRLNKEQRAARRELIKPDEGLLARLARASQVSSIKPKTEPRGKGWKFLCGRCGQTSYFPVPAAICECGAIAIKD